MDPAGTTHLPKPSPLLSGFHFRGQLPHLKRQGALYFVTMRLGDSLPSGEIARLKQERDFVLKQSRAAKRPLTWHEEQQLLAWFCDQVEALLDAGKGACWLSEPRVAQLVATALNYFAGQRYDVRSWVIMPNHVHVVIWPRSGYTLSTILHSWKSFTSKEANKILCRAGERFWQQESFDHWIRDDDERYRLIKYVENNPVKAHLCRSPEDWRWSSANKGVPRAP